ncbi:hypothetical protein AV530_000170 [Patagioenas fasciata monilis]|uniref:Uncharacterized protein n=1 Tax=Patagioenas fasciata monilis TaxID=372326 RepID=A0A1V4K9H0_PATFA|nr:hypothetical protein AV530_000170 [Patagioenas fasciata monilis]
MRTTAGCNFTWLSQHPGQTQQHSSKPTETDPAREGRWGVRAGPGDTSVPALSHTRQQHHGTRGPESRISHMIQTRTVQTAPSSRRGHIRTASCAQASPRRPRTLLGPAAQALLSSD